jgi:hypothetical protein
MKKLLIIAAFVSLPFIAFAEDANTGDGTSSANPPANDGANPPQAILQPADQLAVGITANQSKRLYVTVKRSGTNRLLGSANLSVTDGTNTQTFNLSDPPNPDGQLAFSASPGKYKLTVARNGYKSLENKEFEIKADQDLKLSVDLEANSGIANPEQDYQNMLLAAIISQMNNQSTYNQGGGYINPQTGQWVPNNTQGGYINPQTGQWVPSNTNQGGYINPQTGQWIPSNNQGGYVNPQTGQWTPAYSPTIPQNGYLLSSDQNSIIPVNVKITQASYLSMITNVAIIDTATNNTVNLVSSNQYPQNTMGSVLPLMNTAIYRSGCLKPNSQYILRVSNNQSANSQMPYTDTAFTTGTVGSYTNIELTPPLSVSFGGTSFVNLSIQNLAYQPGNFAMPTINCPSNYQNGIYNPSTQTTYNPNTQVVYNPNTGTYTTVGTTPTYGTTTWGDQNFNPANFGNYNLQKNPLGTYYLVSNLNPSDVRPIKFVQNNDGIGGLAFVSAESGISSYSSQWYITTYTEDFTPSLQSCISYLQKFITDNNSISPTHQVSATNIQYIRDWITEYQSNISEKTKIMPNYYLCKRRTNELVQGLASNGITYPAFNTNEPSPTLNMTKFSRVNFTPEEYQLAITGQVYTSFSNPQ